MPTGNSKRRLNRSFANLSWGVTLLLLLAAGCASSGGGSGLELLELSGRTVDPLGEMEGKAAVFLFIRSDCPISNRYAPEIGRLYQRFFSQGIKFRMVYLDPHETVDEIRRHIHDYGYQAPVLLDPSHQLVKMTGAKVTPEAAVFLSSGKMIYRGRIDDWYVDFGKYRTRPISRDLEEVLEAIVAGERPAPRTTEAVGCFISDLE